MTDLNPCPFCGGTDLTEGYSFVGNWPVVQCDSCGAEGPRTRLVRADANRLWNERAIITKDTGTLTP